MNCDSAMVVTYSYKVLQLAKQQLTGVGMVVSAWLFEISIDEMTHILH